ncbi:MAG TPA: hypothetical protein VKZ53_31950 [Candidatus Angelobacter sp.]|nr:hypothetical protein [Candidatus Angelobacter sp.]
MPNVQEKGHLRSDTLNSWKEIARYLDRGVRTVQRWERDLNLPVRRPWGKKRSAVVAIRKEIDVWISCCPQSHEIAAPVSLL